MMMMINIIKLEMSVRLSVLDAVVEHQRALQRVKRE